MKFKTVFSSFLLFLCCLCASSLHLERESSWKINDRQSERAKRVVNGNTANQHEWPWQVSIERFNQHICGGSLIKRDWVLTAAHCIEATTLSDYTVVVGVHNLMDTSSYQERLPVTKIILHEYDTITHVNDIALVKLEKNATISKGVQVISLPVQGQRVETGTKCYITGWGRDQEETVDILQEAELKIDDINVCKETMKDVKQVYEASMICAIGHDVGGCHGDSGGPLSCLEGDRWIIRGVVSWGHQCSPDYHTIFARVSSYVDWIKSNTVCMDKYSYCSVYQSLCDVYDFMKTNCRATCNLC